jgi:calcium-dependent protein kinase
MLMEQDKDLEKIKIVDFGTSLMYDPTKKLEEKLGTAYYIAPEVIKNYVYFDQRGASIQRSKS